MDEHCCPFLLLGWAWFFHPRPLALRVNSIWDPGGSLPAHESFWMGCMGHRSQPLTSPSTPSCLPCLAYTSSPACNALWTMGRPWLSLIAQETIDSPLRLLLSFNKIQPNKTMTTKKTEKIKYEWNQKQTNKPPSILWSRDLTSAHSQGRLTKRSVWVNWVERPELDFWLWHQLGDIEHSTLRDWVSSCVTWRVWLEGLIQFSRHLLMVSYI